MAKSRLVMERKTKPSGSNATNPPRAEGLGWDQALKTKRRWMNAVITSKERRTRERRMKKQDSPAMAGMKKRARVMAYCP